MNFAQALTMPSTLGHLPAEGGTVPQEGYFGAIPHHCARGLQETNPTQLQPLLPQRGQQASSHLRPLSKRTFLSFEDHCLWGQEVYLAIQHRYFVLGCDDSLRIQ